MLGGHSARRKSAVSHLLAANFYIIQLITGGWKRTWRPGDIQRRQESVHSRTAREQNREDLGCQTGGFGGIGAFVLVERFHQGAFLVLH